MATALGAGGEVGSDGGGPVEQWLVPWEPTTLPSFVKVNHHPDFGSVKHLHKFHGLWGSKGRKIAMGFFLGYWEFHHTQKYK